MPGSLCDRNIPPLVPPWADLAAVVRFCWASEHPSLEVRFITISGFQVPLEPVVVANGETVAVASIYVPWGATATWTVGVLVNDVTNSPMKGLSVVVELFDAQGRGTRGVVASKKEVPPGELKSFADAITAPAEAADA